MRMDEVNMLPNENRPEVGQKSEKRRRGINWYERKMIHFRQRKEPTNTDAISGCV